MSACWITILLVVLYSLLHPKECRYQRVDLDCSAPLTAACLQEVPVIGAHALPVIPLALGVRPECRVLGINTVTQSPDRHWTHIRLLLVLKDVHQSLGVQLLDDHVCTSLCAENMRMNLCNRQRAKRQELDDGRLAAWL
jgi:hypothetical protein